MRQSIFHTDGGSIWGTHGCNTVPALVISEPMIREMHSDAVIIDIASRPGGTDLMAAGIWDQSCGGIGTSGALSPVPT